MESGRLHNQLIQLAAGEATSLLRSVAAVRPGAELAGLLGQVPRLSPCLSNLASLVHHLLRQGGVTALT